MVSLVIIVKFAVTLLFYLRTSNSYSLSPSNTWKHSERSNSIRPREGEGGKEWSGNSVPARVVE